MSKLTVLTAGMFFTQVKNHLEATCNVTIMEEARLDGLCKDGTPIHHERARHALKTTARVALGRGNRMRLHSFTEADKVAAQIILIAKQRQADLDGTTPLDELLSHAFATLGLKYAFSDDSRAFEAILSTKRSKFVCDMERAVLA